LQPHHTHYGREDNERRINMKKWLEPAVTAWIGIISHKLRSILTILGIVIGVAAVIALMSIGKGTEHRIISGIQGLGTNLLFIQPGSTMQSGGIRSARGSAQTLTLEDAEAISQQIDNINNVAPISTSSSQIVAGSQNINSRVIGITPEYQDMFNIQMDYGVPISEEDYKRANKVAVIGPDANNTLFGGVDPVGKTIRMGNSVLYVIGVFQSKGSSMMTSLSDDSVLVPLTTMFQISSRSQTTSGEHVVGSINVELADQKYSDTVTNDITDLLRYRHRISTEENDFSITSQEEMIATISEATSSMTFLLGAIAAISLLVGGIGVMNIMLVSVMERTREIGIRKALGAEEIEIITQFLIEAAFLTVTGGIIGIGVGWGASYLVGQLMSTTTIVTADIVILAFSISVAIGLVFGLYPAWRASRLSPIEALRYE
jgi:putative ABC transport system permease protein